MIYENKGGQSREDCMRVLYVLANKFKAPQKGLAATFGCSQSTISAWNKEAGYKARIYALETELEEFQKMQCTDAIEAINNHQYEPPRLYRRVDCLSQAALSDSIKLS